MAREEARISNSVAATIMKRIDRYILGDTLPPFIFGIGAFVAVLVGVELLYDMLRLIYQEGFPAVTVAKIFLLKMPGVIVLCFPMATMFASLMAMGRLSGDGELVAIRAGGVSVLRVGLPILLFGFTVAAGAFIISETLVPWASNRSWEITRQMYGTVAGEQDLLLQVSSDAEGTQRVLYAEHFDTDSLTLRDVFIFDFTAGSRPLLITAESARWQGQQWIMRNVEYTSYEDRAGGGEFENKWSAESGWWNVGRTPEAAGRAKRGPDEMSLRELLEQAALSREDGRTDWANRLQQHYHVRLALPWATLGLAVLGLGLGVQRQRSSRGIGMGLSLIVLFIYYVVLHTLTLVGERGIAPFALMAWTPNILLYLTGVGFLLRSSR